MRMRKGWETSATRSLARQMYGGPNSMKQVYRDEGCKVWWVDGWGHGGFFVAVTDASKCRLNLTPPKYGGTHEWKYTGGGVALTVHVYEEDVEWSWFVNDNPWFAEILVRKLWAGRNTTPEQILDAAKRTEASYPRKA